MSAQDYNTIEKRDEQQEEDDFVKLGRMAGNAIAEIYTPGQESRRAVGIVGESGEKASNASDGNAERERYGVQIACGLTQSNVALDKFNRDEASDERTNDSLPADEVGRIVQITPGQL